MKTTQKKIKGILGTVSSKKILFKTDPLPSGPIRKSQSLRGGYCWNSPSWEDQSIICTSSHGHQGELTARWWKKLAWISVSTRGLVCRFSKRMFRNGPHAVMLFLYSASLEFSFVYFCCLWCFTCSSWQTWSLPCRTLKMKQKKQKYRWHSYVRLSPEQPRETPLVPTSRKTSWHSQMVIASQELKHVSHQCHLK